MKQVEPAAASPPRKPSRLASMSGGEPDAVAPLYSMVERERQERIERAIESSVAAAQGAYEDYLPPETEGVTAYMENESRKRFLAHRGLL